jgi:hypothetical protein
MFPFNKGIMVNNGYAIADMDILINHFMDINMGGIDLSNVDTVGTIVTMAIIYFSGCQGNP